MTSNKFAGVIFLMTVVLSSHAYCAICDGGWRISVGAVYDSGVRSNVKFIPNQVYHSPYSKTAGASSKEQAKEAAWGKTTGTRTEFVNKNKNGAVSYVDTVDDSSALVADHDKGKTENYRFPESIWGGYASPAEFELGYAEYEEITSEQASFANMESHDKDEYAMPGVTVRLSRNLYHNVEYHWGVEATFAVQYFRRNHIFNSNSSWVIGNAKKETGYFRSEYVANGGLADALELCGQDAEFLDWFLNHDANGAYFGKGDALSAGPVDANSINRTSKDNPTETNIQRGALDMDGDYENLELMFLLQPYYDIFDWLSINATLGPVVSRQSAEMSFLMVRNGQIEYQSKRDFYQWDVYGVAGLGFMLYYEGFTLSGDFMARFFDDDMEIKDEHYHGTIGRGHWMFRLGVGYEF